MVGYLVGEIALSRGWFVQTSEFPQMLETGTAAFKYQYCVNRQGWSCD